VRRGLTCCFGVSLIVLISTALLLFVGLPMLLQYLTSQDRQPIFDIHEIGQRYRVGSYDVILIGVSACAADLCQQTGQTNVKLEVVRHGAEAGSGTSYNLSLVPGQSVSNIIELEGDTGLRLVADPFVAAGNQQVRVRFQAFLPPD
jgi:hypothetical protein